MEGQGFTYVGRLGRANKKANVKAKISFLEALDLAKRDLPIGWEESVPGLVVQYSGRPTSHSIDKAWTSMESCVSV